MTTLARAIFVLLVGATFAAFFAAQRIKGEPAVARVLSLARVFSPNGDGAKEVNRFEIHLRERREISVDVVDSAGDAVRRLVDAATVGPSRPLPLTWDGRSDDGDIVRDGRYRVRVTLRREGRSVVVPRSTLVDTRAPRPRVKEITPGPIVGPVPGPMQFDVGSVSRRLLKRGRVYRTDGGAPRLVAELAPVRTPRTLVWDGKVDGAPAPPGTYLVQVAARDRAANRGSRRRSAAPARRGARPPGHHGAGDRRRGAAAAGDRGPAPARQRRRPRAAVSLAAAARRPHAPGLSGRKGPRRAGRAAAPRAATPGCTCSSSRPAARTSVPVMVQSRERAIIQVVVPALTWVGTAEVDQDADGMPNTLEAGTPVSWPRVLAGGLPRT